MNRKTFHAQLAALFPGLPIYYQPPENLQMSYPCIVYELEPTAPRYADGLQYIRRLRFQVTLIDPDPDSPHRDTLDNMKHSRFSRAFTTSRLNHFVFSIYA